MTIFGLADGEPGQCRRSVDNGQPPNGEVAAPDDHATLLRTGWAMKADGWPAKPPPAAQVLRMAVGLLGFEAHEKPNSWAYVWQEFQERSMKHARIQPADGGKTVAWDSDKRLSLEQLEHEDESTSDVDEREEWKVRVLKHLRQFLDKEETSDGEIVTAGLSKHSDKVPELQEHLSLAEFLLSKIIRAVSTLQRPETEWEVGPMVAPICEDLGQCLEQVSTLFSLYHVHLLDLMGDKKRLTSLLRKHQVEKAEGEEERKASMRRHKVLEEHWSEDKTRRRAEDLLGITVFSEEEEKTKKIFSQEDLDKMHKDWEEDHLVPMYEECKRLRHDYDKLEEKYLKAKKELATLRDNDDEQAAAGSGRKGFLPPAGVLTLAAILKGVEERTLDGELCNAVAQAAQCLQNQGAGLPDVLELIKGLPYPMELEQASPEESESIDKETFDAMRQSIEPHLERAAAELGMFGTQLKGCPADVRAESFSGLIEWSCDTLKIARGILSNADVKGTNPLWIQWPECPEWDLSVLRRGFGGVRRGRSQNAAVQTGGEFEAELEKLKSQVVAATEKAQAEKRRFEEVLKKLEAEALTAELRSQELYMKLQEMEALLLKAKGQGYAVDMEVLLEPRPSAIFTSTRKVYERLWKDAVERMRRFSESQAEKLQELRETGEYQYKVDIPKSGWERSRPKRVLVSAEGASPTPTQEPEAQAPEPVARPLASVPEFRKATLDHPGALNRKRVLRSPSPEGNAPQDTIAERIEAEEEARNVILNISVEAGTLIPLPRSRESSQERETNLCSNDSLAPPDRKRQEGGVRELVQARRTEPSLRSLISDRIRIPDVNQMSPLTVQSEGCDPGRVRTSSRSEGRSVPSSLAGERMGSFFATSLATSATPEPQMRGRARTLVADSSVQTGLTIGEPTALSSKAGRVPTLGPMHRPGQVRDRPTLVVTVSMPRLRSSSGTSGQVMTGIVR